MAAKLRHAHEVRSQPFSLRQGATVSALRELLNVELVQHDDAWWFYVEIQDGRGAREEVARLLATDIACRLCEPSADAFNSWAARSNGGPEHDPATRAELEAYLLSDFAETDDMEWSRLGGAVVEHFWAGLAGTLEGGWGLPLHVEHEHFSVIDHGGDGLSIYSFEAADLCFRLWESKRHTSAANSVTTIVTHAADQLDTSAPAYLARLSKPLQLHADPRIQDIAGRLVKLWTSGDEKSGVGVSVGTSTDRSLPERPFKGLKKKFAFAEPARREGVIIQIPDLAGFARLVQAALLAGIE